MKYQRIAKNLYYLKNITQTEKDNLINSDKLQNKLYFQAANTNLLHSDSDGFTAILETKNKNLSSIIILRDDHLVMTILFVVSKNKKMATNIIKKASQLASSQGFTHIGIPNDFHINKLDETLFKTHIIPDILAQPTHDFVQLVTELLDIKSQETGVKYVPSFDGIKPLSEKLQAMKEWKKYIVKNGSKIVNSFQSEIF